MMSSIRFSSNAETMLASVFGTLADGVAVHDPAGSLILACPVAEQVLRLARQRMKIIAAADRDRIGKRGGSQAPADERQALTSLRSGQPFPNVVLRFAQPAPAGLWILAHSRAIASPDNPWCGCVISSFVDMTAAKPPATRRGGLSTELRAPAQEMLFGAEARHVGAWELDPATLELRWDQPMFEMAGMPVQDKVPESTWHDRILAGDLPGVRKKIHRTLLGKSSAPVGFRVKHADGVPRHFLMTAAMAFDHARQPACVVGLTLDQTGPIKIDLSMRPGQKRPRGAQRDYSGLA